MGDHEARIALLKAIFRWERARTEFRRATDAGTQPRMQRAGNRLYFAELNLRAVAKKANEVTND